MGKNNNSNQASKKATPAPNTLEDRGNRFVYDGEQYEVVFKKLNVPGIGIRTAVEVCVDPRSQKYLVEKCLGTAVKRVS